MVCMCCKNQRKRLHPVDSLMGGKVLLCTKCKEASHQPRHIVVIVSRSDGQDKVREHIINRQYCGDEVVARETIA